MRACVLVLALVALAGCPAPLPPSEIKPDVRWGSDPCAECLMIINEARFAAAYVTTNRKVRRFDDIGGMLEHDRKHGEPVAAFWVHDYEGQVWLRVSAAQFVYGKGLETPMGSGLVALATRERADALAKEHGAVVMTWNALVKAKVGIGTQSKAADPRGGAMTGSNEDQGKRPTPGDKESQGKRLTPVSKEIQGKRPPPGDKESQGKQLTSVSKENLGKRLTLEGKAANAKLGAELLGEGFSVWIAGLDEWPDGYWSMADGGKRVRVTGVLTEDHSLPVFTRKEGEPIRSGIEVPPGTDLKAASQRFLLKDATWELLD